MDNGIFRKKSLDKVSSPEQLNEYIRVASPGVWLTLSAIIVFLLGIVVWGIFGTADTVVSAVVVCEDGHSVCYMDAGGDYTPSVGMKLTADGKSGEITAVNFVPLELDELAKEKLLYKTGDFSYISEAKIDGLSDGIYNADLTVESINPISFILKNGSKKK